MSRRDANKFGPLYLLVFVVMVFAAGLLIGISIGDSTMPALICKAMKGSGS